MNWLARIKRFLARYMLVIEFCERCGIRQPATWRASNRLWMLINGSEYGVYCPGCFAEVAYEKGHFVCFVAVTHEEYDAHAKSDRGTSAPAGWDGGNDDAQPGSLSLPGCVFDSAPIDDAPTDSASVYERFPVVRNATGSSGS